MIPVRSRSDECGSIVGIIFLWRVIELSPIVISLSVSIPRIIVQLRFWTMSGLSLSLSGEEHVFRVASIGDESVVTFTTSEFAHLSVIFEGRCTMVGKSERTSERKHVLEQPESIRAGKLSPLSVILTNLRVGGAKLAYLQVSVLPDSHSSFMMIILTSAGTLSL